MKLEGRRNCAIISPVSSTLALGGALPVVVLIEQASFILWNNVMLGKHQWNEKVTCSQTWATTTADIYYILLFQKSF
jgi:hypothetical protein